jgi:hypothetical protein
MSCQSQTQEFAWSELIFLNGEKMKKMLYTFLILAFGLFACIPQGNTTNASPTPAVQSDCGTTGITLHLKYEVVADGTVIPTCEVNQVKFIVEGGTVTFTENVLGQLSAPVFKPNNDGEAIIGECAVNADYGTPSGKTFSSLQAAIDAGINFLTQKVAMSCTFGVGIIAKAISP